MNKREQILIGDIILYGTRTSDGWQFHQSYADQTGFMLGEPEIQREVRSLPNWEAALAALDGERWHRLPGVTVHSEFRERVWTAVQVRLTADTSMPSVMKKEVLARWRDRCRTTDHVDRLDTVDEERPLELGSMRRARERSGERRTG